MFIQNESFKENASAIGGALDPQDGQQTVANASRLVKRDKSSIEHDRQSDKSISFPATKTENATLQVGRKNRAIIVLHPIPREESSKSIAHVDWLGFTLDLPSEKVKTWLFDELQSVFGLYVTEVKKAGWNGYERSAEIGNHGLVAWGGKFQRGTVHVEVNGTGCSQVLNWAKVQAWGMKYHARITRIDLAHDDLEGEHCNINRILEWHDQQGFNCGGRNAKIKLAGDWHDLTDGRTIYVGTRGNKMLRCYEKGKQLDDPESPWFRVELELRNKNRLLPWDMLTRPGQYLAGSYPCLSFLSTEQIKLKTLQKATEMSLESMTLNASRLSGKAINVLMKVHNGDAIKVVGLLRRNGIPKRLQPYEDHLQAGHDKEIGT